MKKTIKSTLGAVGLYRHYQLYRDAWYRDKDRQILLGTFSSELDAFYRSAKTDEARFPVEKNTTNPYLNDRTEFTFFDTHYVYHPAWAARVIQTVRPALHVDIASTLHFASILSAFVPVQFYDYRPAYLTLSNLKSDFADLMGLPFPDAKATSAGGTAR